MVVIFPVMNLRLMAVAGAVALTVALRLAVESAGPVGDELGGSAHRAERVDDKPSSAAADKPSETGDKPYKSYKADSKPHKDQPAPQRSQSTLSPGLAIAARCGPEIVSPEGIEAQTCVLTRGRDTWARTYYRNATGGHLTSVLTLMAPGGRTVQMHCSVGADDEPGVCETPREQSAGDARAYTAVAEFAESAGGSLLLRSGSNSAM